MGLRTKQVPGDQGIDWGQTLLQSGAAEMPKPPSLRRQPPLQQQSEPLKCPRCGSTNTKFCYYNNYNRSQPRHFCKSCKRHWTKGGTLRNVPVGGGRKNKRPKISNAPPAAAAKIATTAALGQQDDGPNNFSLSADTTSVQRSMPDVLYQSLIRSSPSLLHEAATDGIETGFPGKPFAGSNGTNAMDPTEFQFSVSLSTIGANESLIPTSYQSINAYDHNYGGNLDPVVESTISSVHIDPSSSSEPWPRQDAGGGLDLPNYWNWSEIDALNPADLNMAWDDDVDDGAKIKP